MDEVFSIQVSKILWTHYACSHMSSCSLIQTKQYIKIFMVKQELISGLLDGALSGFGELKTGWGNSEPKNWMKNCRENSRIHSCLVLCAI